jgi:hypothetical protein
LVGVFLLGAFGGGPARAQDLEFSGKIELWVDWDKTDDGVTEDKAHNRDINMDPRTRLTTGTSTWISTRSGASRRPSRRS